MAEAGLSIEEILADYEDLERADILASLNFNQPIDREKYWHLGAYC